jgi:hypothetical protein
MKRGFVAWALAAALSAALPLTRAVEPSPLTDADYTIGIEDVLVV